MTLELLPPRRLTRQPNAGLIHSGHIRQAVVSYFDCFQNRMLPEFWIDGGIADMVIISKAGYVTEVEIKTSVADWRVDLKKGKWAKPRPHIKRFYYAIPEALADRIPSGLPTEAGLLVVVRVKGGYARCTEVKAARAQKARKIGDLDLRRFNDALYYRFWRHSMATLGERLDRERQVEISTERAKLRAQTTAAE
jgi:hypothetical protein